MNSDTIKIFESVKQPTHTLEEIKDLFDKIMSFSFLIGQSYFLFD